MAVAIEVVELNVKTMPAILEKCVSDLISKGKSKDSAYAICTSSLQKSGILKTGTQELTDKGKRREAIHLAVKKK